MKNHDKPRQHIKKQSDITLPTKVHIVKAMVFPVVMYVYEIWTIKKTERRTVVLEKTLESALYCQEIKAVNPRKSTLNIHWKD